MDSSNFEAVSEPLFQIGISDKSQIRMANRIDPVHYKPSHQDLHCLQKCFVFKAETVSKLTVEMIRAVYSRHVFKLWYNIITRCHMFRYKVLDVVYFVQFVLYDS